MKTKEELNEIKEQYEDLSKKIFDLTEEELKQVSGGGYGRPTTEVFCKKCGHVVTSWPVDPPNSFMSALRW